MRRTDECTNCGELRELAAHGLCFSCYRAGTRAGERAERQVDRHNPGIRREHKKLFKAHANIMAALSDIGVSRNDVMAVKEILEPYLVPIQEYLDRVNSADHDSAGETVNSEQADSEFTVHSQKSDVPAETTAAPPAGTVNTDEHLRFAVEVCRKSGQVSVSDIDKALHIGRSRATWLIDRMDSMGLVGPVDGGKPRQFISQIEGSTKCSSTK